MIRLLLLLGLFGLLAILALPLFPSSWQLALAIGWVGGILAETLLGLGRQAAMRREASSQALLMVMVFGFLGRLSFLFVGALIGAFGGLFPSSPFLGAALVAFFLGELLTLPRLMRPPASGHPAAPAADSTTHPNP